MRKILIAASCLFLLPLPALAQGLSRDDDRGGSYGRSDRSRDDGRYRPYEDRDHDDWRDYSDYMPRRGSSFHIKIGDARIRVQCGPRETLKDCVDAATMLFDKARSLPTTGSASPGSGTAPSRP